MRTTPALVAAALVSLSLVGLAAPASAADVVSPTSGTNDATTSFTLTGIAAEPTEAVSLTLAGHATLTGTVTNPGAGPGCALGVSDSDCGDSITVSVPLTNAYPGRYTIVRTQTPPLGGTASTTTLPAAYQVLSKPVISSISPATRGADSSSLITVTGTGFAPGVTLAFGPGTVTTDVTYVNATTVTASVAVNAAAAPGPRDVIAKSADDLSGTKTGALTVDAAPTLTAISPTSGLRGQTLTGVTLTGTGFVTGGDFAIVMNGITASGATVSNGGTTLTATLAISSTAVSGDRTVQVTNADGGRARLVNGFRVIAPPGAPSVTAIPADGKVTVAWSPPTDPGSSPITAYTVTPSDTSIAAKTVGPTVSQVVFAGLTNGSPYSFTVTAKNTDAGDGPAATTATVTPKVVPALTALSNRATAISGQSTVIYGYLTRASSGAPFAATSLSLRIAPAVGAAVSRTVTTDAHGRWAVSLPLTYNTAFTASYVGSSTTASRTAAVTVPVGTKITVDVPRATPAGSVVQIRGTETAVKAGKAVGVYQVIGSVSHLIGKGTISASGAFSAPIRLPAGNYLLKVVLGPVSGNATGTSAQFVLKRR